MKPLLLEEVLKLKDSETIYNFLIDKVYELLISINEYKHYSYKEHIKKTNTIKSLGSCFNNNTVMFKEIDTIIYNLGNILYDTELRTRYTIDAYNEVLDNYNKYVEVYNRIEKDGYDKVNDTIINKITILFKDMLDYKNKFYGDKDDFYKLYCRVRLCYYDFSYLLDDINTLVKSCIIVKSKDEPVIKVDTIEYICILRYNYNIIREQYRDYEAYSEDIDLKEGQSIQDLINIIDKKINTLYENIVNKDLENISDFNKKIINSKETLEDKFIYLHNEYSEDIYKIRSIEEDDQLIYYFKNDLYNRIVNDFNI